MTHHPPDARKAKPPKLGGDTGVSGINTLSKDVEGYRTRKLSCGGAVPAGAPASAVSANCRNRNSKACAVGACGESTFNNR